MSIKKYTPRVPSAYKEVEYIESDGTQYIDTGITPSNSAQTKVSFSFRLTVNNGGYQSIGSNSNLNFYGYENYGSFRPNGNSTGIPIDTNWHIIEMSKSSSGKKTIFDGVEYFVTSASEEPLHFYIFALNAMNQDQIYYGKYQFKECKIYENDAMVRDFIPVVRKTDSVAGLYDIVNDVFYTNQGTGTIIAGSDVNSWQEVGYKKYETATDTITTLPKTIIGDGQPISSWSMKGNMSQSGTPTPSNPVYPTEVGEKTANLLDMSTVSVGYHLDVTTGLPVAYGYNSRMATLTAIDVSQLSTVTLAYTSVGDTIQFMYSIFDDTDTLIERVAGKASGDSINVSSAKKLYIAFYRNAALTTNSVEEAMLNAGSTALSYEPYGYKIPILSGGVTTNIYLGSTQTTRKIKKLVLTGQENWEYQSTYSRFVTELTNVAITGLRYTPFLCTHYQPISDGRAIENVPNNAAYLALTGTATGTLNIKTDAFISETAFSEFLAAQYAAGTPVTVWFVMYNPQTAAINEPLRAITTNDSVVHADTLSNATAIPTSGTAQSFDVDTTLKPSEVSLTYHGWHEHNDTKYSNP